MDSQYHLANKTSNLACIMLRTLDYCSILPHLLQQPAIEYSSRRLWLNTLFLHDIVGKVAALRLAKEPDQPTRFKVFADETALPQRNLIA